jgi:hypothetical protein
MCGVVWSVAACAPAPELEAQTELRSQSQTASERDPAAQVCPTTSLIARRPANDNRVCPRLLGSVTFSGTFLATRPAPGKRLFDYCQYEPSQGASRVLVTAQLRDELSRLLQAQPSGTQLLPDGTPVVRVEQDCAVVVPNQDAGDAAAKTADALANLADVVLANAGLRSGRPQTAANGDPTPVLAAVIDTAQVPFDELHDQDLSPHGRAVGLTLLEAACGDTAVLGGEDASKSESTCPIEVRNYLGLPLVNAATQEAASGHGGYLGTRGDLALALRRELDEWPADSRARLLLNLSVGWHGQHNEEFVDELPPPARIPARGLQPTPLGGPPDTSPLPSSSVYWLLQEASCRGALAIAAAGNAQVDDREGPLYPAGWETAPAASPDSEDCRRLVPPGNELGPLTREPGSLVYAVTAVDHAGDRLVTTRDPLPVSGLGGTARRAALGSFVVARDPRRASPYTPPLSGTSMSTAIVSGVAAALWALDGTLASHEVMSIIDRSLLRAPDPGAIDLCLGGACAGEYGIVRRCQVLGQSCPPLAAPDPLYWDALSPPTPAAPGPECLAGPDCPLAETCEDGADCAGTLPVIYPLLEPWAGPQPPGPVCSLCSVRDHLLDKLWENRLPISSVLPLNVKAAKPWAVRLYAADKSFLSLYTAAAWSAANSTLWFAKSGALDRISAEVNIELQVNDPQRGLATIYQLELVPLIKQ